MRIPFEAAGVRVGISERSDGSMVWYNRLPVDEAVRARRDAFFQKEGIDPARVVSGGLTHGIRVTRVGQAEAGSYIQSTDGLITNTPGVFLAITAADCMPIFFFDPVTKSIGIAHAGWRGAVGGIAEQAIREMQSAYGAKPEDVIVHVGPHIKPCHFEVGEEVAAQFHESTVERRDHKIFLKLAEEVAIRLRAEGVRAISVDATCTFCEADRFFSARHDKREPLEGMVAYIGMKG